MTRVVPIRPVAPVAEVGDKARQGFQPYAQPFDQQHERPAFADFLAIAEQIRRIDRATFVTHSSRLEARRLAARAAEAAGKLGRVLK